MDTTELWGDKWNKSSALDDSNTFRKGMGSNNVFSNPVIVTFFVICSVCAVAIFISVFAFRCYVNHRRNSSNIHRRRNRSETCELYQNSETIRERLAGVSLETLVNRPLPTLPEENRQSAGVPAVPENPYLSPIPVDALWLKSREEIERLPPAPPVFPVHLERLPLEGEGAYTPVIPEDEAPLLSPGPMHEIAHNLQLCESSEESGYMVPRSPAHTSLQQNVYRSTYQLYISPSTQHRSPQASTSNATVVVYINTNTF